MLGLGAGLYRAGDDGAVRLGFVCPAGGLALAWLIMALMFQPMLRFYRLSPFWGGRCCR